MFDFIYAFLIRVGYAHPIHPTEVHMPIGLVVGAVVFSLTALLFHKQGLLKTARHCIVLSFIWVFPTIVFGIMDWQHYYAGAWLFPIKVKLVVALLLVLLLFAAFMLGRGGRERSRAVLFLYVLCFVAVVVLGYFGGQMVYGVKQASPSEQIQKGATLFKANCNACHPHGGNVVVPQRPLKGSPRLSDYQSFLAFIRNPKMPDGSRGAMPPFADSKISDPDAKALYGYITQALK